VNLFRLDATKVWEIADKPPPARANYPIMHRHFFWHRTAVLGTVATLTLLVVSPARAQLQKAIEAPTVSSAPATAHDSAACTVVADQIRFDFPLVRTAQLLVSGVPIKIVAFGSSSTYGAGASTPANSYPRRLAEELVHLFPGHKFTVLNRGVGGEDVGDMLGRLDTAVIREKPDLVLWQLGTNSVLDNKAVQPQALLLHKGLARLKVTGADAVLIDPQYAPKVIAKRNVDGMVSLIAATAKAEHVSLFRRFDLMRRWHDVEHLPFKAFVSADGLHMNDWSYACLAKALGLAIAEAAERPTRTAVGPGIAPHSD
jgi:lysophospholipase L1-like esterase